jgi:hypothetical protein
VLGEMKKIGSHALFLCLCFWACLLMGSFFPAHESDHDCGGENCPMCAQAETARSSAGNAVSPSGVFPRPFAELNVRLGIAEDRDDSRRLSLAELMVKLTC